MTTPVEKPRPRGRPGLTEEQREQALEAAAGLLAEAGLEGMKARAIAARAGLSVGSIYKLFGDIDDLVRELNLATYREFAAQHRAALASASTPGAGIMDRLMALAQTYVSYVNRNEKRWMALLAFNRRQAAPPPREYIATENELFGIVETVLADIPHYSDARLRARSARAMWAAVHGIVVITLPNSAEPDPVEDTLFQIELVIGAVIRDAERQQ